MSDDKLEAYVRALIKRQEAAARANTPAPTVVTIDERTAWTLFAAAVAPVAAASPDTPHPAEPAVKIATASADVADAMLDEWRKRWGK